MSRRLRRRITVWTTAVVLGCGLLPQSASACRILQFPAEARATADAAVIVELIEVTPQDDNSFGAKAVARRLAFGGQAPERFAFGNYSRGASCGPLPQIGDLWVVYLKGEEAAPSITAFYPIETAEALDRRVVGSVADPALIDLEAPIVLAALMARGWTEADIRKLAGENLLRVMRRVEAVAADKSTARPSLAVLPDEGDPA